MNENLKKKLSELSLTESESKELTEPYSMHDAEFIQDIEYKESPTASKVKRIRLRGKIKRKCYYFYSKYNYTAVVTEVNTGKRFIMDEISLKMNSGNGDFTKTSNSTSKVSKIDEVYGTDNTCKSAKLMATAIKGALKLIVEIKL